MSLTRRQEKAGNVFSFCYVSFCLDTSVPRHSAGVSYVRPQEHTRGRN